MSNNKTNCFAIRRLSPFKGCTQVIEAGEAQAISSNGLDWRIQVRVHEQSSHAILFGFWSEEGGFHRVPLDPMLDSHQVEVAAQPIIDVLLELTRRVPFAQQDHCELWLLDAEDSMPLVLIAASREPDHLPAIRHPEWQPTLLTDHSFTRRNHSDSDNTPAYASRDTLASLIKQRVGQNPVAQWFERHADGQAKAIDGINVNADIRNRTLPKEAFPPLLIREDWPDTTAQELINDYIEWQAPYLLTLPTLNDFQRKQLEQLAFRQCFKVEDQHKLWPKVIDEQRLKAILIEVKMRRSHPEAGNTA